MDKKIVEYDVAAMVKFAFTTPIERRAARMEQDGSSGTVCVQYPLSCRIIVMASGKKSIHDSLSVESLFSVTHALVPVCEERLSIDWKKGTPMILCATTCVTIGHCTVGTVGTVAAHHDPHKRQ